MREAIKQTKTPKYKLDQIFKFNCWGSMESARIVGIEYSANETQYVFNWLGSGGSFYEGEGQLDYWLKITNQS